MGKVRRIAVKKMRSLLV